MTVMTARGRPGANVCSCGATFAPTLEGAWQAKLHAEDEGHRLVTPRAVA